MLLIAASSPTSPSCTDSRPAHHRHALALSAGFVGAMTRLLLKSSILKSSETPFISKCRKYRMPHCARFFFRLVTAAKHLPSPGRTSSSASRWLSGCCASAVVHVAGSATPRLTRRQRDRPPRHFIEPAIAPLASIGNRHRPALRCWPAKSWSPPWAQLHGPTRNPGHAPANRTPSRHDSRRPLAAMNFFARSSAPPHGVVRRETNSWEVARLQFLLHARAEWGAPSRQPHRHGIFRR